MFLQVHTFNQLLVADNLAEWEWMEASWVNLEKLSRVQTALEMETEFQVGN